MDMSLRRSVSCAPVPFDVDQAARILATLPEDLNYDAMRSLARGVAGSSPFLGTLLESQGAWIAAVVDHACDSVLGDLISDVRHSIADADWSTLLRSLRVARARAALYIALCDLGGVWDLHKVTRELSDVASGLTEMALRWIIQKEVRRGKIPGASEPDVETAAGLFIIAMGKMGARELNYSSDIDLICLFNADRFAFNDQGDARARFIYVIRQFVKALSERTEDGYVFRTDLRLRPRPSTTPVCMSMGAAERYYAEDGRTWERAAHIKARPVAGDMEAGRRYLRNLEPFIWRSSLDFAAIEDIEDIVRKIRIQKGHFSPSAIPGCDIKLSPGGIREIELFVQTRQLIMGGRLPVLREPSTCGALSALRDEGVIDADTCETLTQIYMEHRTTEHRLQMIHDKQTQTIPLDAESRSRIAALDGWADRQAWEDGVAARLKTVHHATESFFDAGTRMRLQPETVDLNPERFRKRAFENPEEIARMVQRWRRGDIAATNSERTQRLYLLLEADILDVLERADNPELAFGKFDMFMSGLSSGLHVFSMFRAHPHLLKRVIEIFVTAPRLADLLGRWTQTLDAHFEEDFLRDIPSQSWLAADLHIRIGETENYERMLEITRTWAREVRFRAAVHVLTGRLDDVEAGEAFSVIAEATLEILIPRVIEKFAARYGPVPGRGLAVIAMGKLGTREMTAQSDLDLIVVYDAEGDHARNGALSSSTYYSRLTRSLISALTVDTIEGRLYSVDMRLRPSGRKGPVAVSLASFDSHQTKYAWVWEHLALMRGRVLFGSTDLVSEINAIIHKSLLNRVGDQRVMDEAREMRQKLIVAHRAERENNWAFKHTAGGLMEIEFMAQTFGLFNGLGFGMSPRDILKEISDVGEMTRDRQRDLNRAIRLQSRLQHIDCVALKHVDQSIEIGERLRTVMVEATEVTDFETLIENLRVEQQNAASICAEAFAH